MGQHGGLSQKYFLTNLFMFGVIFCGLRAVGHIFEAGVLFGGFQGTNAAWVLVKTRV